jgi:hypothetical protein
MPIRTGLAAGIGLAALLLSAPAGATLSVSSLWDASACFDAAGGTPVAYDPVAAACNAGGGNGAFRWELATQANGDTLDVSVRAAAAADSATGDLAMAGSGVYQAGEVDFELGFSVDVPDGAAWEIDFEHAFLGLSALRGDPGQNVPGASSFAQSSIVGTVSAPCAFPISPQGLGGFGTGSFEISGGASCSAWWSGVGDAVLVLPVRFLLEARSLASEAAFLLGLDDVLPGAGVTADDHASWGRSPTGDGYTATFTLRVTSLPEPACALLLAGPLAGAAARARRRR